MPLYLVEEEGEALPIGDEGCGDYCDATGAVN
jgi:hypothetical protein